MKPEWAEAGRDGVLIFKVIRPGTISHLVVPLVVSLNTQVTHSRQQLSIHYNLKILLLRSGISYKCNSGCISVGS
jgi:hypothetical protein